MKVFYDAFLVGFTIVSSSPVVLNTGDSVLCLTLHCVVFTSTQYSVPIKAISCNS